MIYFYWVMGVLLALFGLPALVFFVLYLATGEDGCQHRARFFFQWTRLFGLLTFNVAIWRHVITGFWVLFFP